MTWRPLLDITPITCLWSSINSSLFQEPNNHSFTPPICRYCLLFLIQFWLGKQYPKLKWESLVCLSRVKSDTERTKYFSWWTCNNYTNQKLSLRQAVSDGYWWIYHVKLYLSNLIQRKDLPTTSIFFTRANSFYWTTNNSCRSLLHYNRLQFDSNRVSRTLEVVKDVDLCFERLGLRVISPYENNRRFESVKAAKLGGERHDLTCLAFLYSCIRLKIRPPVVPCRSRQS